MNERDDVSAREEPGLARRLGLATATALVIGEVIGVGIFLVPAGMAKSLGSPGWLLVVWLTMGAGAIGGALCYGALAARYPQAGGSYVYLKEAYGPRTAFLYGWLSLFVTDPGLTAMLAAGLATRRDNPADRREVLLGLTATGRRIVRRVTAKRRDEISRIVSAMPSSKRANLIRAFRAFALAAGEPDNHILECAVEAKAHFVVSGDSHLKTLRQFREILILGPRAFLDLFANLI